MNKIQLWIDGSTHRKKGLDSVGYSARKHVIGAGLIAHFKGQTAELTWKYETMSKELASLYELIACIEAMLFAQAKGYAFSDMVFYTDDFAVAYAAFILSSSDSKSIRLQTRMEALSELYAPVVLADLQRCIKEARFHKVKSHQWCVDNNRVDYLARQIAADRPIESFEKWFTWHPHIQNFFEMVPALAH